MRFFLVLVIFICNFGVLMRFLYCNNKIWTWFLPVTTPSVIQPHVHCKTKQEFLLDIQAYAGFLEIRKKKKNWWRRQLVSDFCLFAGKNKEDAFLQAETNQGHSYGTTLHCQFKPGQASNSFPTGGVQCCWNLPVFQLRAFASNVHQRTSWYTVCTQNNYSDQS